MPNIAGALLNLILESCFMYYHLLKFLPVLIAGALVGHWFLSEVKKAKRQGSPWYKPYFSVPGIIIIIAAIIFPILANLFMKH
jgi:hypothetical protein